MIEPLRMRFEVRCPPAHAFSVWTRRASSWWPPAHTVTAVPGLEIVFEAHPGGRIFERTAAGREVDWGEIRVWEPPGRLIYLWHLNSDRSDATEVEIRFEHGRGGGTVVEIEHRGWEALGARGQTWREANSSGWAGVLPHFRAACAEPPPPPP